MITTLTAKAIYEQIPVSYLYTWYKVGGKVGKKDRNNTKKGKKRQEDYILEYSINNKDREF